MIEPIPHADEADVAEQARSVDDDVDEGDYRTAELRETWHADAGDILEQQLAVSGNEDERPHGAAGVTAYVSQARGAHR